MIENDDNPIAGIDLAAWQAPPASERLADAVVERMREPAPAVATERDERGGRRWWLIAAVLAAAAVVAVLGVRGMRRAPRDGHGSLAATHPAHLDLGASSAELETGADITWQRARNRLDVMQRRGVATWRVTGDDELVIHAGATVASVEATGASLRVEVEMNLSDARLMGTSAAVAAAVSLVTVVVYEGHVKVTGGGQTVNVAPGNTVAVGPNAPPRTVSDDQRAVAGTTPRTVAPSPPPDCNAMLERGRSELQQGLDAKALRTVESALACDPALDTELNHTVAYMAACRARDADAAKRHFARTPTDKRDSIAQICLRNGIDSLAGGSVQVGLGRKVVDEAIDLVRPAIEACRKSANDTVTVQFDVTPSGVVSQVTADPSTGPAAQCIVRLIQSHRYPSTQRGGRLFTYTFGSKACDAKTVYDKAQRELQSGLDAAALVDFEQAIKCKPEGELYIKAFMAACRSRNAPKARFYYNELPTDKRESISQICVRNGITF